MARMEVLVCFCDFRAIGMLVLACHQFTGYFIQT